MTDFFLKMTIDKNHKHWINKQTDENKVTYSVLNKVK